MNKVLLLHPIFPPFSSAETQVFVKQMGSTTPDKIDVLTSVKGGRGFISDTSLSFYAKNRFGVVYDANVPFLLRRLPFSRFGILSRLPDPFRLFNISFTWAAFKIIKANGHKIIITRSQPHSIHLVGLNLKRIFRKRIFWIAHFSDPWVNNPFKAMTGIERDINSHLQQRILASADLITVPLLETLIMDNVFSAVSHKTCILPHSYDSSLFEKHKTNHNPSEKLIIKSIGNFYGVRSPEPFLKALKSLYLGGRLSRKFQIVFVGSIEKEIMKKINSDYSEIPCQFIGPVEYKTSLSMMNEADILLLVDAPLSFSPFLPSKLVDYIGSGRPILGVTPSGPAKNTIEELGGWVGDPSNIASVQNAILAAFEYCSSPRESEFGNHETRDLFQQTLISREVSEVLLRANESLDQMDT